MRELMLNGQSEVEVCLKFSKIGVPICRECNRGGFDGRRIKLRHRN